MKKEMLLGGLTVIVGALMLFVGVGGVLADAMISGGRPSPPWPPADPFTGHILLWLVCIFIGSAFTIVGVVRLIVAARRHFATRK